MPAPDLSAGPRGRLPRRVKFGYGGNEWSNSLIWTFYYALFLYFMTDIVRLGAVFAGTVIAVGTVWNAVFQPFVGVWSDGVRSKWGRRRPFLLAVAVPYAVVSWLLFTDWGLGTTATKVYFLVLVLAYFTCYTLLNVPYGALAAEMTQDYDERTSLNVWRTGAAQIAALMGATLPLVLAGAFESVGGSAAFGWSAAAAVLGVMSIFGILLTWHVTRGYELFPENTRVALRDVLGTLRNRSFRYLIGLYAFGWAPVSVLGAVAIYFARYQMGYSETYSSVVLLVWFASGMLWLPLVTFSSQRVGKRWTYILFVAFWAVVQMGFLLVQAGSSVLLYALLVLSSGGSMAVAVIGWALLADVTDVEEYTSGQRREGIYYGVIAFIQTGMAALVVQGCGLVLGWTGYQADATQTATALWGIRLLISVGAVVPMLLGIVCCYLMPLTRARHEALLTATRAREAGEPVDEASLSGIV
jgi:glycoside/pentoside/hexuronide:cation symporter, GPH family